MSQQAYSLLPLTSTASATLSANRFVTFAGDVPSSGDNVFGVVRMAAATGDKIVVDVLGTAIIEAGGSFSAGDEVQTDSSGRAVIAAGGVVLGIALQASTGAGKFVEVLLDSQIGAKFSQVLASNDVTAVSTNTALAISGISLITGGAGLASLTLAAPQAGCQARIRVVSTSGNVVVTTAAGVTFDGTNNTATFNAAADELVLGYKSATEWHVVENTSVTLSSV